jgi:hypothetical protein
MSFWKLSGSFVHQRAPSNMSMISEDSASIGSSMRSLGSFRSTAWAEDCGMAGSLVSTFDRLYVWEKKLYLEVKVCLLKTTILQLLRGVFFWSHRCIYVNFGFQLPFKK